MASMIQFKKHVRSRQHAFLWMALHQEVFFHSFDLLGLKWKVPVLGSMSHKPCQWFLNVIASSLGHFTNNPHYPHHPGKSHVWTSKICASCSGSSCFTFTCIYTVYNKCIGNMVTR